MTLDQRQLAELAVPLDPQRVRVFESGPQKGIAYLEGHDVIRTANDVFGAGRWGFELLGAPWMVEEAQSSTGTPYQVWAVLGRLTVEGCPAVTEIGTNTRSGAGAAGLEMCLKGTATDALKRCLKNYGDRFGLILYDKDRDHQNESIAAWHRYQSGRATVEPQAPVAGTPAEHSPSVSAQDAHVDSTTNSHTVLTRREVQEELTRWQMGTGVVGAFIRGSKTPSQISDAEFYEWASLPEARHYTAGRLVHIALLHGKRNGEGQFQEACASALERMRVALAEQGETA